MSGAAGAVAKAAKPQLRGLLQSDIKKNLIVATILSITATIAVKVLVNDRRKQRFADFYKTYDPEKEFERMRKKGLFDSCDAD